nr:retrotransposon protein, putative, unclassified [Triticum aestivum]
MGGFLLVTAVTINGTMGSFFRNKRGLRQGDPSSPLIFNFVADILAAMIHKARGAGNIKWLVPHLIPGGVTNLQYADDTMLMFEPDDHSIATIKLLLLAFEILSGLKINFLKREVITIGMANHESSRIASLLNCKLGSFPIKYLGLPISTKKLTIAEWEPLYGKVANRVWAPLGKTRDADRMNEIMEQIKMTMLKARQDETTA